MNNSGDWQLRRGDVYANVNICRHVRGVVCGVSPRRRRVFVLFWGLFWFVSFLIHFPVFPPSVHTLHFHFLFTPLKVVGGRRRPAHARLCLPLQDPADGGTLARPHLHRRRVLQRRQDRLRQRPEVRRTAGRAPSAETRKIKMNQSDCVAVILRPPPRLFFFFFFGGFGARFFFSFPFCLEVITTPKVLEYTLGCLLGSWVHAFGKGGLRLADSKPAAQPRRNEA